MQNSDLRFAAHYYLNNSPKDLTLTDLLGNPAGAEYDTLLATAPNGEDNTNIFGMFQVQAPGGVFYSNAGYATDDFSAPDTDSSGWALSGTALPLSGTDVICGLYTYRYKVWLTLKGMFKGYNALGYFTMAGNYQTLFGASPTGLKFVINGAHAASYTLISVTYNAGTGDTEFVVASPPAPFVADPTDVPGVMFFIEKTFTYCYDQADPDIDASSSCVFSQLTSEDETSYPVAFNGTSVTPTITRAWSISGPTGYSASPVTGTTNPFIIGYGTSVNSGKNIWTGTYNIQLTATVVYSVETWGIYTWIQVTDSIVSTTSEVVKCDTCFCDLYQCVLNLFNKYVEYLGTYGAESQRTKEIFNKYAKVLGYWMLFQMAERCGEDYQEYCAEISEIVLSENCQCDVGDTIISEEVIPLALQTVPGSGCCHITTGTGSAGFPASPTTGDIHIFNADGGAYSEGDLYAYNGSAWVYQFNIKGAAGAAGPAGANGTDGADGTSIVFDEHTLDTLVGVVYAPFTNKQVTLTDMSADGDMYRIEALVSVDASVVAGRYFKLTLDGNDLAYLSFPLLTIEHEIGVPKYARIVVDLIAQDYAAKTLRINYQIKYYDGALNLVGEGFTPSAYVSAGALNSIAVALWGKVVTGGIYCQFMNVSFLKS